MSTQASSDYDPMDPAALRDPYPNYARFRRSAPVAHTDRFGGFWVISRYADVRAAAADTETYRSADGVTLPPFGNPIPFVPIEIDPPRHVLYRRPLQRWFSKGKMIELEHDVRRIVTARIDGFIDAGRADLAAELAEPVPPITLARVLGLPESDWSHFMQLGQTICAAGEREDLATAGAAVAELMGYLQGQIDQRRAHGGDDMLTRIARMEVGGAPMSDQDVLGAAFFLVEAGHETTVGGIGTMLLNLARHPEIKDQLIADPTLIPAAVEEALRYDPPIQTIARTVAAETTLHDVTLHKGDRVVLCWGSANRDETVFEDADQLRITRERNNHLAFGSGVHHCLGAPLARMEMRVVLEEVLRRIPDYRIENEDDVVVGGFLARAVKRLPVAFGLVKT
ncbi:MAG TPA: cytochrome P450 [Pseudonocardia sp.]